MSWTAYFQVDGELRWTIATRKFQHTAEHERDLFVKRMTHPTVGVWFTWVEETNEPDTEAKDDAADAF